MTYVSPIVTPSLPADVVLRASGVSKKFCISLKRSLAYGIADLSRNMLGVQKTSTELRKDEFWAVRDINFELRRGECLGLIGMNGSGKSTLLRLLTGVFPPDQGEIAVRGRVGALIAVGAGFHPHLTGRENIYLNGAILGLTRHEINTKLQEIIDFAEVGEFIEAPVSTYSSGMRVKLGFAIAIKVEPDLLLIDEVLAVGDMGFTIKCLNTVRALLENTAIVFVSHNMQFVSQFCTRVMVMNHGSAVCHTPNVGEGIGQYLALFPVEKQVSGMGDATIANITLSSDSHTWNDGQEVCIGQGKELTIRFDATVAESIAAARVAVYVMDQSLTPVIFFSVSGLGGQDLFLAPGRHCLSVPLGTLELNAGKYSLVIAIADAKTHKTLVRIQGVGAFQIISKQLEWGYIVRNVTAEIKYLNG